MIRDIKANYLPLTGKIAIYSASRASTSPPAALSINSYISISTDYLFTPICQIIIMSSISKHVSIVFLLPVSPRIVDTAYFKIIGLYFLHRVNANNDFLLYDILDVYVSMFETTILFVTLSFQFYFRIFHILF